MPLAAESQIILGWTILLLILAGFTGYWSWRFYRQLASGSDPMAAPFMLKEMAYTNMFLCFAIILGLILFDHTVINITYLAWGVVSTLIVVISYVLFHYELKRKRDR